MVYSESSIMHFLVSLRISWYHHIKERKKSTFPLSHLSETESSFKYVNSCSLYLQPFLHESGSVPTWKLCLFLCVFIEQHRKQHTGKDWDTSQKSFTGFYMRSNHQLQLISTDSDNKQYYKHLYLPISTHGCFPSLWWVLGSCF